MNKEDLKNIITRATTARDKVIVDEINAKIREQETLKEVAIQQNKAEIERVVWRVEEAIRDGELHVKLKIKIIQQQDLSQKENSEQARLVMRYLYDLGIDINIEGQERSIDYQRCEDIVLINSTAFLKVNAK